MTIDDESSLDDLISPEAEDAATGKPAASGGLWTRACALNSVEFELMGMAQQESALKVDIPFIEVEDEAEPIRGAPEPTEIDDLRAELARKWGQHIQIARSLGSSGASWSSYIELCKQEGIEPCHPRKI
jgi:hypothetical protein